MVKWLNKKWTEDILKFLIGILIIIMVNQWTSSTFFRLDLTEEGRYSIKDATKEILKELDDNIYVDVYLEGDLNASFKRFQKSIRETLEEFALYSDGKVIYRFVDPKLASSAQAQNEFMAQLAAKGIQPVNIIDTRDGQRTEKRIYPGALISYAGAEKGITLLQGFQGENQVNNSIQNIEYNIISTIYRLTALKRKQIGFIQGHGEAQGPEVLSIQNRLFEFYDLQEVNMQTRKSLSEFDLVVIAKPQKVWSEPHKFLLDQYIMNGGKAIFLLDRTDANMDSANREMNLSFPVESNLEDMLFQYGVRVNSDLVLDNNAALYPIVTGQFNGQPQITPIPWPFYPVMNYFGNHPISKNLDAVLGRFTNSIDTVKAQGIKKTPLIMTSAYSKTVTTPAQVSVADLRKNLNPETLNQQHIPIAYLLEGPFTSLYKNRFLPEGISKKGYRESGESTGIIVIADGDFIKNDMDPETGEPMELGNFRFQPGMGYANDEFLINAISYLIAQDGIITARNKEIRIRPLDKIKVNEEKTWWQTINLLGPVLFIVLMGMVINRWRTQKYTKYHKDE